MLSRRHLVSLGVLVALSIVTTSCVSPSEFLNPSFLSALGASSSVATLPGEAPGLLVSVENLTNRAVEMVVSYRDGDGDVNNYTTYLDSGDKSAQMLVCPISEITLGNVGDLTMAGVRVALVTDIGDATINEVPYMDVEPFGRLLRDGVNYDCGDSIEFVVLSSGSSASGYQTVAYFRRLGGQDQ